jgi:hypothetical protein
LLQPISSMNYFQNILQIRSKLFDFDTGQIWILSQSQHQSKPNESVVNELSQVFSLQSNWALDQKWLVNSSLAYSLQQVWRQGSNLIQGLQSAVTLNFFPHPLHVFQLGLGYTYNTSLEAPHLLNLGLGYQWRYGYEVANNQGRLKSNFGSRRKRTGWHWCIDRSASDQNKPRRRV